MRLLVTRQSVSVPADVLTHNASISAREKGLQWRCALQLLESMQSVSVPANVKCPLRLLELMPSVSVSAAVIPCNASVGACEIGQRWRGALRRLRSLQSVGQRPRERDHLPHQPQRR